MKLNDQKVAVNRLPLPHKLTVSGATTSLGDLYLVPSFWLSLSKPGHTTTLRLFAMGVLLLKTNLKSLGCDRTT